jgi:hypothetical protein
VNKEELYDTYIVLPKNFKNLIRYTGNRILYRGTDNDQEGVSAYPKINSFTPSKWYAEYMGRYVVNSKQFNYNASIDTAKVRMFLTRRKNKKLEREYSIGDDEGEIILMKIENITESNHPILIYRGTSHHTNFKRSFVEFYYKKCGQLLIK